MLSAGKFVVLQPIASPYTLWIELNFNSYLEPNGRVEVNDGYQAGDPELVKSKSGIFMKIVQSETLYKLIKRPWTRGSDNLEPCPQFLSWCCKAWNCLWCRCCPCSALIQYRQNSFSNWQGWVSWLIEFEVSWKR